MNNAKVSLGQFVQTNGDLGAIYRYRGDDLDETRYISCSSLYYVNSHEVEDHKKWDEMFLLPNYLSYGDYDRSTAVERSNYEVFLERYGDIEGVYEVHGGYNSRGIAIRLNTINKDEMFSLLSALQEYPVIDEERWSELEHEMIDEAWEDYGYDDVVRGIEKKFDIDLDDIPREKVVSLVHDMLNLMHEYPFIEAGGIVYLPTDKIIQEIELEDINE